MSKTVHTFNHDTDRCTCGGQWDNLDDGYACETAHHGYEWATAFSGSSDPEISLRAHHTAGPAIRRATLALERGDGPDVAFQKIREGAESMQLARPMSDERYDRLVDLMGDLAGIS